jgi:hypothetical protein
MQEFEIYLPLSDNLGRPIREDLIESLKDALRRRFGGFTFFPQESEGEWETGGYRFRDRIVILRVLTGDAGALEWFGAWRSEVAEQLGQEEMLVIYREVEKV